MVDFKEEESLKTLNHSCAHVLAQAVKHLYPQAKFWVGPVVSEGFYYDIDLGEEVIRDEDLQKIEKEMKKVCKSGKKIMRREMSKAEALEFSVDESSEVTGTAIMNLSLKKNLLICSIFRENHVLIPSGQDKILPGDKVVVVTKERRLNRLKDILDTSKR